jgi:hypothetical protein
MLYWILNQMWLRKWLYLYPIKIMSAYFGKSIMVCQLFNQKYLQSGQIYIPTIELESFVYYIIIQLTNYKIWLYYIFYSCLFWIENRSDPHLYSSNMRSIIIFNNIILKM